MNRMETLDRNGGRGPRLVLLDLDGTLVDSVPDIAVALNTLFELHRLGSFSEAEVRAMVGHGIGSLLDKAHAAQNLSLTGDDRAERLETLVGIYMRNLTGRTVLMPGAREFLALSAGAPWKLCLITNKLQVAAEEIIAHFGLSDHFALVLGDSGMALKPAPDMLLHAAESLGCRPSEAVMVGDSPADVEATRAARMPSIVVEGGYTNVPASDLGADLVISGLGDLARVLSGWPLPAKPVH